MTSVRLDDALRGQVLLACVEIEPVVIGPASAALWDEIEALASEVQARWSGVAPGSIEGLTPARRLYRTFGIDPTRTRPSSEALLRRMIAGKPFPRISNAVDLANLLAVRFLLPIGLYDRRELDGAVILRRGQADEAYEGIRKSRVHLQQRPVLADARGAFGNPTSDSARTAVRPTTEALLLTIFAPPEVGTEALGGHADTAWRAMRRHLAPVPDPRGQRHLLQ